MTKEHLIYKIYYDDICVYLGRTSQPINTRLHGHFFAQKMHRQICVHNVSKIEVAKCKTQADMFLYEVYYINLLKPIFNCDDKAYDDLTIKLADLKFKKHVCHLMDKWKAQIVKEENKSNDDLRQRIMKAMELQGIDAKKIMAKVDAAKGRRNVH